MVSDCSTFDHGFLDEPYCVFWSFSRDFFLLLKESSALGNYLDLSMLENLQVMLANLLLSFLILFYFSSFYLARHTDI